MSNNVKEESSYRKNYKRISANWLPRTNVEDNDSDDFDIPRTFNVLSFGAKGDRFSDDTKAFQAAWQQACEEEVSSILSVPSGYTFLVGQIQFSGPCRSAITFQVGGNIVAPTDYFFWLNSKNLLQWIEFAKVRDLILKGTPSGGLIDGTPSDGLIDGRGAAWWFAAKGQSRKSGYPSELGLHLWSLTIKPTAVRFYGSINVTVQNLAIVNSPQTHLKFDNRWNVSVSDVFISAPASSPNTDGIHLQNTKFVTIQSSFLRTGDDCVSIQTGSGNVMISGIVCGPGHGISIGGLGFGSSQACVSNISVLHSVIQDSQNGVRIKTWQGGSGSVKQVAFSNITVSNVINPIIIDQFYCDKMSCQNKTSAVSIANISYRSIRGTYAAATSPAVKFSCSDSIPCRGIVVDDIHLLTDQPDAARAKAISPVFCWNSFGRRHSETVPNISCLEAGDDSKGDLQTGLHDTCQ